jgi:hypothetical protein
MTDWHRLCRGARRLTVEGDSIKVACEGERFQRVSVIEACDVYEIMGVVAKPSVLSRIEDPHMRAWKRNRTSQLVGFRIDKRGWLIGQAWITKAGLGPEEFVLYVLRVAAECDRFEWELTGVDRD